MNHVGSIIHEEAYALSKMLDHSAWQKGDQRLPRGITGSDIDAVYDMDLGPFGSIPIFDNGGRMIFAEFARRHDTWDQISSGQRRVYQGLVTSTPHCSVICRHDVEPGQGRKICTRYDVLSFQPMFHDHGIVVGDLFVGKALWQDFVFRWFDNPVSLRRYFLGKAGK